MPVQEARRPGTALEAARKERRAHLGRTIRSFRGDVTQYQLAERIAHLRGEDFQQTSISRWELGLVDLSVEQISDIEQALELEPGAILVAAGYVARTVDVAVAIRSDKALHPDLCDELLRIRSTFVDISQRLAATAPKRRAKVAAV